MQTDMGHTMGHRGAFQGHTGGAPVPFRSNNLASNPEFMKLVAEYERRAAAMKTTMLRSEIVGHSASWYVLVVCERGERAAAGCLSGRGFGVYLPEKERTAIVRGAVRRYVRPLMAGYLFVFVWDIERHARRILSVPGAICLLSTDGGPAVISDAAIRLIQAEENQERPLAVTWEEVEAPRRRKKNRWRKSHRRAEERFRPQSSAYSALALDSEDANPLLDRNSGLAS